MYRPGKALLIVTLAAILISGCAKGPVASPPPMPTPTPTASPTPAPTSVPATPTSSSPVSDPAQVKQTTIDAMLDGMSTNAMVGQVFMLACRLDTAGNRVLAASQGFDSLVSGYHLGGVILFGENIETVEQTVSLIDALQAVSAIPLFVSVDEEGGRVSRISKNPGMGATVFPPMAELGAIGDPELTRSVGQVIGEELYALGFNMDLAPVADVATNPDNPVIGDRSFSGDPHVAAEMVKAFVAGMQSAGVAAVIKHFPGHGDTSEDTHEGAAVVSHDLERLRTVELVPFASGIEAGAVGVISAHIQVPNVTGNNLPATLSRVLLTDILRDEMGFTGVVITDALEMKAISGAYSSRDACVQAFLAGADMLLMPEDPSEAYQGLLAAVQDGTVSTQRLRQSVERILSAKYDLGLFTPREVVDPKTVLGSDAHRSVEEAVDSAYEALP